MGIISDAIDALEDWCKDLFKDGIQSQFDGISDLLTDTFSQTTGTGGSGGLVNDFVTQHPSQFTGGGTGGTTIWTTIETLCNNVVVPIGGFILTVILLNELIQMVLRGNNFKDFDDSIFIKWIIKALCGVIFGRQHLLHRFGTILVWHNGMLQRTCHTIRDRRLSIFHALDQSVGSQRSELG